VFFTKEHDRKRVGEEHQHGQEVLIFVMKLESGGQTIRQLADVLIFFARPDDQREFYA